MTVSSISGGSGSARGHTTARSSEPSPPDAPRGEEERLGDRYRAVRARSESLCAPLSAEDMVAQSMSDASPAKWHLAHTTWFFETFVLAVHDSRHRPHHPRYEYLFNSYYNGVGERHPRPLRGSLTRPSVVEVREYREAVDAAILELIDSDAPSRAEALRVIEVGLHHEQQHQELLLTDIKHLFSQNALDVRYREPLPLPRADEAPVGPLLWIERPEGIHSIGHDGGGFAFDNERPRHRVFLEPHALADRLITNREYLDFVADGGYARPDFWLDQGWAKVHDDGWTQPFYWRGDGDTRQEFTLAGLRPLVLDEPVSHVSFFEADAFARWAGARLPREGEWEVLASLAPCEGNFAESQRLHPQRAPRLDAASPGPTGARQLFGDLWEWTSSSYGPYPGFRPEAGTLGEYNGKFMSSQMTLRGGSCASARAHVRATYRNFFYPPDRWQFSGIRLAKEL